MPEGALAKAGLLARGLVRRIAARGIWVQAALLAAALVWAYWLSHPSKDRPSGADQAFALWSVDAEDVLRIRILLDKSELTLEPQGPGDQDAPFLWVTAQLPEPPPAQRPPPEKAEQPEEESGRRLQFKGNRSAEQNFASLATLMVQRRIGTLEETQGEAFGLPSQSEFVEVERKDGGEPLRLYLGGATYGDLYRYAHFAGNGAVYLLRQSLVQNLARAPARMMDRELFPFPVPQAQRVELRSGEKAVSFWRLSGAETEEPEWGDAPDAADGDSAVLGLMNDLTRLKVAQYLAADAAIPEGSAPLLEIRLFEAGDRASWVRFVQEMEGFWIARSSHTRHPVRLPAKAAATVVEAAREIVQAR